jgi:hypothetical protein
MTMDAIGRKRWAIAEGHIPSQSSFTDRALISHETACILNAGSGDAHVALTIFFADRDPAAPTGLRCRRGARCICALTISRNRRRFRATPTFLRCSSRMFRLSFNTHGLIHVTPR